MFHALAIEAYQIGGQTAKMLASSSSHYQRAAQ